VLNVEFQHFILRFNKNSLPCGYYWKEGMLEWKEAQKTGDFTDNSNVPSTVSTNYVKKNVARLYGRRRGVSFDRTCDVMTICPPVRYCVMFCGPWKFVHWTYHVGCVVNFF
jgi:hypothetical protein